MPYLSDLVSEYSLTITLKAGCDSVSETSLDMLDGIKFSRSSGWRAIDRVTYLLQEDPLTYECLRYKFYLEKKVETCNLW